MPSSPTDCARSVAPSTYALNDRNERSGTRSGTFSAVIPGQVIPTYSRYSRFDGVPGATGASAADETCKASRSFPLTRRPRAARAAPGSPTVSRKFRATGIGYRRRTMPWMSSSARVVIDISHLPFAQTFVSPLQVAFRRPYAGALDFNARMSWTVSSGYAL